MWSLNDVICFVPVGVVGGGMPEGTGTAERRHVPLYGRLVAEEQLASMSAPSDIQVSAAVRTTRAFHRHPAHQVNEARGSLELTMSPKLSKPIVVYIFMFYI